MKKLEKDILILFVIGLILIIIPNQTFARNTLDGGIADIVKDGSKFLTLDNNENAPITDAMMKPVSDYIYNVLLTIGIVLALAIGIILGIQFILGSIEEQAKIKEALIPYIIACLIIFGGFTIWKIVIKVGNDIEYEAKQEAGVIGETSTDVSQSQATYEGGSSGGSSTHVSSSGATHGGGGGTGF